MLLALVDVFSRDLRYVLHNLLTVWFFLVPIVYQRRMVERHAARGHGRRPDALDHRAVPRRPLRRAGRQHVRLRRHPRRRAPRCFAAGARAVPAPGRRPGEGRVAAGRARKATKWPVHGASAGAGEGGEAGQHAPLPPAEAGQAGADDVRGVQEVGGGVDVEPGVGQRAAGRRPRRGWRRPRTARGPVRRGHRSGQGVARPGSAGCAALSRVRTSRPPGAQHAAPARRSDRSMSAASSKWSSVEVDSTPSKAPRAERQRRGRRRRPPRGTAGRARRDGLGRHVDADPPAPTAATGSRARSAQALLEQVGLQPAARRARRPSASMRSRCSRRARRRQPAGRASVWRGDRVPVLHGHPRTLHHLAAPTDTIAAPGTGPPPERSRPGPTAARRGGRRAPPSLAAVLGLVPARRHAASGTTRRSPSASSTGPLGDALWRIAHWELNQSPYYLAGPRLAPPRRQRGVPAAAVGRLRRGHGARSCTSSAGGWPTRGSAPSPPRVVAGHALVVQWGQQVRGYSLATLLVVVATLLLLRAVERPTTGADRGLRGRRRAWPPTPTSSPCWSSPPTGCRCCCCGPVPWRCCASAASPARSLLGLPLAVHVLTRERRPAGLGRASRPARGSVDDARRRRRRRRSATWSVLGGLAAVGAVASVPRRAPPAGDAEAWRAALPVLWLSLPLAVVARVDVHGEAAARGPLPHRRRAGAGDPRRHRRPPPAPGRRRRRRRRARRRVGPGRAGLVRRRRPRGLAGRGGVGVGVGAARRRRGESCPAPPSFAVRYYGPELRTTTLADLDERRPATGCGSSSCVEPAGRTAGRPRASSSVLDEHYRARRGAPVPPACTCCCTSGGEPRLAQARRRWLRLRRAHGASGAGSIPTSGCGGCSSTPAPARRTTAGCWRGSTARRCRSCRCSRRPTSSSASTSSSPTRRCAGPTSRPRAPARPGALGRLPGGGLQREHRPARRWSPSTPTSGPGCWRPRPRCGRVAGGGAGPAVGARSARRRRGTCRPSSAPPCRTLAARRCACPVTTPVAELVDALDGFAPDILTAYPSVLALLAAEQRPAGCDRPAQVFAGGEVLRPPTAAAVRGRVGHAAVRPVRHDRGGPGRRRVPRPRRAARARGPRRRSRSSTSSTGRCRRARSAPPCSSPCCRAGRVPLIRYELADRVAPRRPARAPAGGPGCASPPSPVGPARCCASAGGRIVHPTVLTAVLDTMPVAGWQVVQRRRRVAGPRRRATAGLRRRGAAARRAGVAGRARRRRPWPSRSRQVDALRTRRRAGKADRFVVSEWTLTA